MLLAAVAVYGRWEAQRSLDAERRGILGVRNLVGEELLAPSVSDYYGDGVYVCLRYWAGGDPFALSLCYDGKGRLVEAVDERSGTPKFYSLRYRPAAAPVTVSTDAIREAVQAIAREQERVENERKAAAGG